MSVITEQNGLRYMSGFGNQFATEAVAGTLPEGRNSPQRAPHGLYAELLSGSAFTAPRGENRRTWMYRKMPSAAQARFRKILVPDWQSAPFTKVETEANRFRWSPWGLPTTAVDFIDGMTTVAANGATDAQTGCAAHVYTVNKSMGQRYLINIDAEMLIVPQSGALRLRTELGVIDVRPNEIAVIPRGVHFAVDIHEAQARGYVCENYGQPFRLPELGPIGSNGLANHRDFLTPVAAFESTVGDHTVVRKFLGNFYSGVQQWSPLDVVGWHGNLAPYKYDLANFMVIGTVSFDHPDPSIYTVLTSPSHLHGTANCDFVIFPPRWLVGEDTFRPPWFHRNIMSELMGLVHGAYDAKAEGFVPGGVSIHNCMMPHGPDAQTFEKASAADLAPHKLDNTMAFMFESCSIWQVAPSAMAAPNRQQNYDSCWTGFVPAP